MALTCLSLCSPGELGSVSALVHVSLGSSAGPYLSPLISEETLIFPELLPWKHKLLRARKQRNSNRAFIVLRFHTDSFIVWFIWWGQKLHLILFHVPVVLAGKLQSDPYQVHLTASLPGLGSEFAKACPPALRRCPTPYKVSYLFFKYSCAIIYASKNWLFKCP